MIYLCKGELEENLGDDYDQNIFVSNSDQIFSDIMKYFKNLYENGCDEYPRITMKYKVGNELVTLGLIECILDKEELDNFDNSIKNCNEIFGFEPVEIEKEDFLIEKSKPIFYYGIDYLEWDIDLENIRTSFYEISGEEQFNAEDIKDQFSHLNEQSGPVFKIKDDPRLTRVGKFIRKYSIDELPQLFNILLGSMALIGPRPLPVSEVKEFNADFLHRRHSMKPGVTGLWQVKGRNNIKDFNKWVKLDLEYIDNWSFLLDFRIAVKTVSTVLSGTGM